MQNCGQGQIVSNVSLSVQDACFLSGIIANLTRHMSAALLLPLTTHRRTMTDNAAVISLQIQFFAGITDCTSNVRQLCRYPISRTRSDLIRAKTILLCQILWRHMSRIHVASARHHLYVIARIQRCELYIKVTDICRNRDVTQSHVNPLIK